MSPLSRSERAVRQDGHETGHQIPAQESTKILDRSDPKSSQMDLREGTVNHKLQS
jgi:hypothetical protein